jgi:23S rRNA pseudouridine1911/1915/1917 synthase
LVNLHPGGQSGGTLLNALLNHAPALAALPRAGIVHRLDKDTSGLMVVAKTERARHLIEQLRSTASARISHIVNGVMVAGGTIDARRSGVINPTHAHGGERPKPAVSHYRVKKKYRAHTVQVKLESGAPIRVHMAHLLSRGRRSVYVSA